MASIGLVVAGWSERPNQRGGQTDAHQRKDESVQTRSRGATVQSLFAGRLTSSIGDATVDVKSHVSPSVRLSVRRIGNGVPSSSINTSCCPALFNDSRTLTSPRTYPEITQVEASRSSTIQ